MQSSHSFAVLEGGYNGRVTKWLGRLLSIEIDALRVYRRAVRKISDERVVRQLLRHIAEHERHVAAIEEAICGVGGKVPRCSQSLRGWLIERFVALRSATGTEGALTAIKGNEDRAHAYYSRVVARRDLPPRVRRLILALRDDLRRHSEYMMAALRAIRPEAEGSTDPGGAGDALPHRSGRSPGPLGAPR